MSLVVLEKPREPGQKRLVSGHPAMPGDSGRVRRIFQIQVARSICLKHNLPISSRAPFLQME